MLPVLQNLRVNLGGWFRAQCKLMGLTFLLLTIGFLILRVEFPLLLGALIALVDALPMLGTGTVLVPWGLLVLLQGQTALGLGLIALYGVTALTRSILEPRMVGRQLGLNPLLTLVALYIGYRLWGILGMILAPVLTITILEIWSMATAGKRQLNSLGKTGIMEKNPWENAMELEHCLAVRPPVQLSEGGAEHVHWPHEPAEMDGRPVGQWTTCPDQHSGHAGGTGSPRCWTTQSPNTRQRTCPWRSATKTGTFWWWTSQPVP